MAYDIPYDNASPPEPFPTRRGPARQRSTRDYPTRLIADIFVPLGNIGGQGRGQERVSRGERPQGHEGGGGGGAGGDESEGWSGGSGGGDATLDARSEEGEEEHAPLKASQWGMQESGARGIRVGARAGGSGGGNVTSRMSNAGDAEPPWVAKRKQWEKGRPPGLVMCRTLGSGGKLWGP